MSIPKAQSWQMFDRIAGTYDRLNRILSGGQDILWRRKMARMTPSAPKLSLLDLATGTGDQLIAVCRHNKNIHQAVGMDLSEEMLAIGRTKLDKLQLSVPTELSQGDATQIPCNDNMFDVVTISFGIRNVANVSKALREMHRVLRPGGRALIMEFSTPNNSIIRAGYLTYFRHVLPKVGGWVSGDREAYRYLNETSEEFPYGENFCKLMRDAGFQHVQGTPLTFGIATIYQGDKTCDEGDKT